MMVRREEEQVANKKLKRIVKFSRVFEVEKVAELLKTGLPDDFVNIFKKYSVAMIFIFWDCYCW